ncbi:MAG: hypothetical protein KJ548_12345, partial [Actinobacteria bacterium]|nr:hypothetical protein [Actinomycetota bacterium]
MLKRLVIAVIGAVGVLVVGLAVASATLWRADDVLVATVASDQAYVVTAPGVIDVGGAPATVTARTSAGHPVVVVVGRDTDVLGWIGEDPYELVTGLSGWHTLATRAVTATASAAASDLASGSASDPATASDAAAPATATPSASSATTDPVAVADPAGSDMWTASDEGTGSASVTWPSQSGRWSVLAASPDGTATTLSIAWPRTVTTPYLWPGVVAGGLLVLLALGLVARLWWTSRRAVAGWTAVEPAPVEVAPATAPRTRRELREAERLAAGSRSEVPRTGSVERVARTTSPGPAGTFAGPGGSEPPAAARPGPFVGTRSETAGGTRQTDPTAGPAQLATDPQVPPSGESVPRGRRLLPRRRPAESVGHGPVVDRPTDALPVPGGPEAATSVPGAVGPRPAELRSPEPEPLFPRGARGLRRAASTSEPSVSGPDGPAGAPGRTADPSPAGAASAGTTSATGTPSATGASGHPMWTPTRPSG